MTLTGHDRILQQYWRKDIEQVTGVTPGPAPDSTSYVTLTAGAGLTGGGTLDADREIAVGAGDGITVNADDVALASSVAGAGLTYTVGVLAVGAGEGMSVGEDTVGLASSVAGAGLGYAAGVISMTTPGTLSASSVSTSAGSHTHAITASADPGAAAALLKSAADGTLKLEGLGVGIAASTGAVMLTTGGKVEADYTAGWSGSGFSLQKTAGGSLLELDDLSVRGTMNVYELLIHQIRATNGSIFVANTGKVKTSTSGGVDGSTWGIATETAHGFSSGDLIRAQRFTGSATWKCDMVVSTAADTEHFIGILTTAGGGSTSAPAEGMEFVRLGNTDDPDRQGSIYLTADDTNAPYINVIAGVSTHSDWGTSAKTKVRLGNMNGAYGVSADSYGIGLGEYVSTGSYLTYSSGGLAVNAGGGAIRIDESGLRVITGSTWDTIRRLSFESTNGSEMAAFQSIYSTWSGSLELNWTKWRVQSMSSAQSIGELEVYASTDAIARLSAHGNGGSQVAYFTVVAGSTRRWVGADVPLWLYSTDGGVINFSTNGGSIGLSTSAGRITFTDASPDTVSVYDATFQTVSTAASGVTQMRVGDPNLTYPLAGLYVDASSGASYAQTRSTHPFYLGANNTHVVGITSGGITVGSTELPSAYGDINAGRYINSFGGRVYMSTGSTGYLFLSSGVPAWHDGSTWHTLY